MLNVIHLYLEQKGRQFILKISIISIYKMHLIFNRVSLSIMSPTLNKLITLKGISKKIPSFSLLVNLYLTSFFKIWFSFTSSEKPLNSLGQISGSQHQLNSLWITDFICIYTAVWRLPQLALKVPQGQTLASILAVNATLLLILL